MKSEIKELLSNIDAGEELYLDELTDAQRDFLESHLEDGEEPTDENLGDVYEALKETLNDEDDLDTTMDEICDSCGIEDDDDEGYEEDSVQRKAGYRKVQVVRNGKKVWVNRQIVKRKKRLSPAQKAALIKARAKAHTSSANAHRVRSMRVRGR